MIRALRARLRQGHRTTPWPGEAALLPERFRGYPEIRDDACPAGCRACVDACPFGAVACEPRPAIDLGRCLFCADCAAACPEGALRFTADHRLAANRREELIVRPGDERRLAGALDDRIRSLFGRSLKFREVSAGGCNACEADTNVLTTIGWDVGRFGVQFVASPRHADGMWVTGPVSLNMKEALLKTWEAIPAPKIVVACGACAINGGPFLDLPDVTDGVDPLLPVDLYIPGCPPHPLTMLDGLLRLLGRL